MAGRSAGPDSGYALAGLVIGGRGAVRSTIVPQRQGVGGYSCSSSSAFRTGTTAELFVAGDLPEMPLAA
jgi:hypothetical protein